MEDKFKVLIVDDNPENLNVLYNLLQEKYNVFAAERSELVVDMAVSHMPDIIVLDIMMPGLNGYQVCENLKSLETTKDIPVIFMSALSETIDIIKGFEVGGVDYITKPYQKEVVLHRLWTHIDLAKSKKEIVNFNNALIHKVNEKTSELEERIEEITRMNHVLRESEDKYHKLFSSAPEGILIINASTTEVIDANSSAVELFNTTFDSLLDKKQDQLFLSQFGKLSDIDQSSQKVATSNMVFRNKIIRDDGDELDVELTSRLILIEGEMCQQVTIRDITKQTQYENGLKEAKRKSEELNELKSAFLANMAHELRTPLIGILGYSQILTEEIKEDGLVEMIEGIHNTGQRLLNTLNLLMDLSMLGEKNHTFKAVPINISEILRDVCEKMEPKAEKKSLTFFNELIKDDLFILGDERMIKSIFVNLTNNAVKFTENGSVTLKSSIKKDADKELIEISVKDTGIGISQAKIDLVFEEFRQESEGISRDYQGLGLGLTLTKKFVDFNKGQIYVVSKKNAGTEFTVTFNLINK